MYCRNCGEAVPDGADVCMKCGARMASGRRMSGFETFIGIPDVSVPDEIRGPNWGAFLLPLLWCICHSVWVGLLCLVPPLSLVVRVFLLIRGNEWGWASRRFQSVQQFRDVQRAWLIWGLVLLVVEFISIGLAVLVMLGAGVALGPRSSFQ